MEPHPKAALQQPSFDWEKPGFKLPRSENERWIDPVLREGGDVDLPLEEFLQVPVHSPRIHYQLLNEFKDIRLENALSDLRAGKPSNSTLWLYNINGGQAGSDNGVMSAQKAHRTLQRKHSGDFTELDASVTRFHLHHPTPESIGVLILNAKQPELCVLGDFLWKHIRGQKCKPSIRFNIENGGKTFSLTYHIPSFVLRTVSPGKDMREDSRKTADNKPWRKSRNLTFLSPDADAPAKFRDVLYETQQSFTIYGYNKLIWTSSCLVDTYFYEEDPDNQDTAMFYTVDPDDNDPSSEEVLEMWDPSTIGKVEANKVMSDPCDFFFLVLSKRANQLQEEWMNIFNTIQKRISTYNEKRTATIVTIPISRDSAHEALKCIQKNREWLEKTEELLELLTCTLRGIIVAWNDFKGDDWSYLPKSEKLWSSYQQIVLQNKQLGDILKGFYDLEDQCRRFRKKLELDIEVQSGPVISLHSLSITFIQIISPVAISATIIQAQILSSLGAQWIWFLLLNAGFFVLHWLVEPTQSLIPPLCARITDVYNRFSGGAEAAQGAMMGNSFEIRPPQPIQTRIKRRLTGFSDIWKQTRELELHELDDLYNARFEYVEDSLPPPPLAHIRS